MRHMACKLERQLEKLRARYERDAARVIAEAREKYVIPYCERHGLRFVGGMGTWCFRNAKRSWGALELPPPIPCAIARRPSGRNAHEPQRCRLTDGRLHAQITEGETAWLRPYRN